MPNAVFIILGSNFDPCQESQLKFGQELIETGYNLTTYSIDSELPPSIENQEGDHETNPLLIRIQMELTNNNLNELIKEMALPDIDYLVIMDSIDFKWVKFGHKLKRELSYLHPHLADSPVIHFISLKYENPTFNGDNFEQFDFNDFRLTKSPEVLNRLSPYIKDLEKLVKIEQQIVKQGVYRQLNAFMRSPGFKTMFSDPTTAKQIIKEELMKHVCEQIDLKKIGYLCMSSPGLGA